MVAALVLISINTRTQAQAPNIQWQHNLGGTNADVPQSCQQTADGGYIVGGYTASSNFDVVGNHGATDCWVVKLTASGSVSWKVALGGPGSEGVRHIKQTWDGGYIIAGYNTAVGGDVSMNHGSNDCWIVKLSSTGVISWRQSFGGFDVDNAYSIRETFDGGFIVAGAAYSIDADVTGNHGSSDTWVIKLSSVGSIQWKKCYGGTSFEQASDIIQTTDSGYFFTGYTYSSDGDITLNHGYIDIWAVKLDDTGRIEWQKTIGGTNQDDGYSCVQATDGGFFISGLTLSTDGDITSPKGNEDVVVAKLSATGTVEWVKNYGGSADEAGRSVFATPGNGCVVACYTTSNDSDVSANHGSSDAWIFKLAANGSVQWKKTYGGTSAETGYSICATADHGYFFAASGQSTDGDLTANRGNDDFWTVKLDSCTPPSAIITVTGATLSTTTFDTYQWLLNGHPIPGATSGTYVATADGSYTVVVTTAAGCDQTSPAEIITLASLGITKINTPNMRIHPNPVVSGQFHLFIPAGTDPLSHIVITNPIGERIKELDLPANTVSTIDFNVPGGVYFISATSAHYRYTASLVVQ